MPRRRREIGSGGVIGAGLMEHSSRLAQSTLRQTSACSPAGGESPRVRSSWPTIPASGRRELASLPGNRHDQPSAFCGSRALHVDHAEEAQSQVFKCSGQCPGARTQNGDVCTVREAGPPAGELPKSVSRTHAPNGMARAIPAAEAAGLATTEGQLQLPSAIERGA